MYKKRLIHSFIILCFWSSCLYGQERAIPRTARDASFEEAMQHYRNHNYGMAQVRFNDYLQLKGVDRIEDYKEQRQSARLYEALASLWLEDEDARYKLEQIVSDFRPETEAWLAAKEVGNALYNKKRYRDALAFYKMIDRSLLSEKDAAEVSFKMGYSQFVKKKYADAIQAFNQATVGSSSYYYPANYYLGMCSFLQDDLDEAATYFERVRPSKQYRDFVPYYLTQIYFARQDYQQVVDYAEPLLTQVDIEKKDEIKKLVGRSHFELGNETKALAYLKEVEQSSVALTSSDHYQVGYLSYNEGAYDEAIGHLKEIAALENKTGHQANYYLGHAYIKKNNKEAARSAFANVKRRTSNKVLKDEATYNYGLLSAELNHDRAAVNALMEIEPTSTYYSVAQEALAKLFLRTNDFDNALSILESIPLNNPTLKEAYQKVNYLKGRQLVDNGQFAKSISFFNKAIDNPVNNDILAESYFSRGLAQHVLKKYSGSIQSINRFQTISSNGASSNASYANYIQGYNYLKQKKYAEAKTAFEAAASSLQHTGDAQKQRADALIRKGDCAFHFNNYDEALQAYTKAYEMKKADYVYAYYQAGVINGLKQDHIQSVVIFEDLQSRHPKSPWADDALVGSSQSYLTLGEYDKAANPLLTLTKQYKQSDRLAEANLSLGLISYNKGAIDQAIQFYKKVFSTNPSAEQRQDASRALQEIYINDIKDIDEYLAFMETTAGGKIENTVRDSLNYRTAYNQYANADYREAERQFTKYLTNFPEGLHHVEAHYLRGECYALDTDYSNAYRDYTYVVDQGSGRYYEKSLRKAALIAYNDIENYDAAFTYFKQLGSLNLTDQYKIEAYLGAMRSAFRLNKRAEAREYGQLVQAHPKATVEDIAATDYYLATILYEEGDYDAALTSLNRLSKQSNDENAAQARYLIANIYFKRKEMKIAEEMCRLAIKDNVNYPFWVAKSIILLSDILVETGDTFNAKAALEAVIENFHEEQSLTNEATQKLANIRQREQQENPLLRDSIILETPENNE